MSGIILDGRYILAREALDRLGAYAGMETAWLDKLWAELVAVPELFQEFIYYVDHHGFADKMDCCGYRLTDLYVFRMSKYNLIHDIGKNTESCNKESLVLETFYTMACMLKNPDKYIAKLLGVRGEDR